MHLKRVWSGAQDDFILGWTVYERENLFKKLGACLRGNGHCLVQFCSLVLNGLHHPGVTVPGIE